MARIIGPRPLLSAVTEARVRRIAVIAVFPAFAIFYLVSATQVPLPGGSLAASPRAFPELIGVLMVAVAITISAREVWAAIKHRRVLGDTVVVDLREDDEEMEKITSWRDAWVAIGALVLYVAAFAIVGFLVATVLFVFGLATYIERHWIRNAIVAVAFAIATDFLFASVLGVSLPRGIFGVGF
jgi:hypothetical protein